MMQICCTHATSRRHLKVVGSSVVGFDFKFNSGNYQQAKTTHISHIFIININIARELCKQTKPSVARSCGGTIKCFQFSVALKLLLLLRKLLLLLLSLIET